jgi:hypothetical protein
MSLNFAIFFQHVLNKRYLFCARLINSSHTSWLAYSSYGHTGGSSEVDRGVATPTPFDVTRERERERERERCLYPRRSFQVRIVSYSYSRLLYLMILTFWVNSNPAVRLENVLSNKTRKKRSFSIAAGVACKMNHVAQRANSILQKPSPHSGIH